MALLVCVLMCFFKLFASVYTLSQLAHGNWTLHSWWVSTWAAMLFLLTILPHWVQAMVGCFLLTLCGLLDFSCTGSGGSKLGLTISSLTLRTFSNISSWHRGLSLLTLSGIAEEIWSWLRNSTSFSWQRLLKALKSSKVCRHDEHIKLSRVGSVRI